MNKRVLGILIILVALVAIGILVRGKWLSQHGLEDNKEIAESTNGFHIETLCDKKIYSPAHYASVCFDVPQINIELVSITNSYAILNAAYCDAELWFRFGRVVTDSIKQISFDSVWDKEARDAVEKYVNTLVDVLPQDTALWVPADSVLWDKVWTAYRTCAIKLAERFSLKRYGKITEKDVEKYMDAKQFIPNYDSIYDLRRKQSEENEEFLLTMAEQATDFDSKCLYAIEYAHQCRSRVHKRAISMLASLMKSGKYSRYLNEVWRTWRCLRQLEESPSRDGMIPNLEYNRMRYYCLGTISRKVKRNPKNIYAMNDFCFMASFGNITRYSEYPYGNSAGVERMLLFPELFEENK